MHYQLQTWKKTVNFLNSSCSEDVSSEDSGKGLVAAKEENENMCVPCSYGLYLSRNFTGSQHGGQLYI